MGMRLPLQPFCPLPETDATLTVIHGPEGLLLDRKRKDRGSRSQVGQAALGRTQSQPPSQICPSKWETLGWNYDKRYDKFWRTYITLYKKYKEERSLITDDVGFGHPGEVFETPKQQVRFLTAFWSFSKTSLASSKEHRSSKHSLSRLPCKNSSNRKELALFGRTRTALASRGDWKTEEMEE